MDKATIESLDNRLQEYFDKYVPACGVADTLGGEMVRAMMRLLYRYYNDGDMVGVGYGNETCNSSNRFLMEYVDGWVDLFDFFSELEYEDTMYDNVETLLIALDNNPELFTTKNEFDSRKPSSEDMEYAKEFDEDED